MRTDTIAALGACPDALEWLKTQPSMAVAWKTCERADWQLWLLGRLCGPQGSPSHRKLVLAACACSRTSLKHIPAGELRPLRTIETAEAWARGDAGVTPEMVQKAANEAYRAAYAADAAYDAACAAAAVYAACAWRAARLEMCAIIRQRYPAAPRVRREK